MDNDKHLEKQKDVPSDNALNKCATDHYDLIMSDPASVMEALDGAMMDSDMREEVGSLIIKIEKFKGPDTHSMLQLAKLIIDKATDQAYAQAECYANENAGDE